MRKRFLAFALVLVVSGVVPLMANWGSCDDLPCCHVKGMAIGQGTTDCCSPATCIKEEKGLRADDGSIRHHIEHMGAEPAEASALVSIIFLPCFEQLTPLSPPSSTGERLATLSILLI